MLSVRCCLKSDAATGNPTLLSGTRCYFREPDAAVRNLTLLSRTDSGAGNPTLLLGTRRC